MNVTEIKGIFHCDCDFPGRKGKTAGMNAPTVCGKNCGNWLRRMWL